MKTLKKITMPENNKSRKKSFIIINFFFFQIKWCPTYEATILRLNTLNIIIVFEVSRMYLNYLNFIYYE